MGMVWLRLFSLAIVAAVDKHNNPDKDIGSDPAAGKALVLLTVLGPISWLFIFMMLKVYLTVEKPIIITQDQRDKLDEWIRLEQYMEGSLQYDNDIDGRKEQRELRNTQNTLAK